MNNDTKNFENLYSGWVAKRPIEIISGKGVYLYDKKDQQVLVLQIHQSYQHLTIQGLVLQQNDRF